MAAPAPKFPIDLSTETAEAREVRLVWERERLAEAEDDLANGRYIEGDEAIRWLENEIAEAMAEIERYEE